MVNNTITSIKKFLDITSTSFDDLNIHCPKQNENRNIWLFYLSSIEKNILTKDDKIFHTQLINIFEKKF